MKTFTLILFVSISINILAQNQAANYSNILPKEITQNESLFESAIDVILREAAINPEMIYYRVNYYNEIYKNKNTDKKTNGYDELNNAKIKYLKEKNALIDKEINGLDNDFLKERHAGSVESFWNNLKDTPTSETFTLNKTVDKNLMNFYAVFYHSNGIINNYDSTENYLALRNKYEEEIRDKIINIGVLLEKEGGTENYGVDEIIEKNISSLLITNDIDYSKVLLMKEKADYSINNLNKFSVGLGVRLPALNKTTPIIYTNDKYEADVEIGNREDIRNIQFDLGYKIFLKDEIDLFSYLNISAFYINSKANINLEAEGKYIRKTILDTETEKTFEFYTFTKLTSTNSHDEYGIIISTPVFVIKPQMIFEFGLQLYYQNNYSIDMTYDYKKVKAYYNTSGYLYKSEVLKEENGVNDLFEDAGLCVAPSLSFQYNNFISHFDFAISYVYNSFLSDQITAGFKYTF
jgi:hypothetical protein